MPEAQGILHFYFGKRYAVERLTIHCCMLPLPSPTNVPTTDAAPPPLSLNEISAIMVFSSKTYIKW